MGLAIAAIDNLGRIKTYKGNFASFETFMAFDRKWKHDTATQMNEMGYQEALNFLSLEEVETMSGTVLVPKYFCDHFQVLTVLDPVPPASASSYMIEVTQEGTSWKVDIGVPSYHSWWYFDTLKEAAQFAIECADRINSADNPDSEWKAILSHSHG